MILILLAILLLVGTPIAVAIGLSGVFALFQNGISMDVFTRTLFAGVDSFSLMAIPFFVYAGDLMLAGGISKKLIDFAKKLVGRITGGLPIAGVMSSMIFAAISGSSPATVAAIGGVMIPSLNEARYPKRFSVGLIASAGTLGIIIPPSITLLVYGGAAEVSISDLFIAGIIPGIFIGIVLMIVSYVVARRIGVKSEGKVSLLALWDSFRKAIWGLVLPIVILGGIYKGIFTPTEAAAIAIVYSLLVGKFVYKELTLQKVFQITIKSVITSAMIMLIIAAANIFSWYLTYQKIPEQLASHVLGFADTPVAFLLMVTLILLIAGMFLDASAAVLIFTPLFLPIVLELGIDPIHFGIIMIVNLAIGMITPPFGLNLYVAAGISKMSITEIIRGTVPFIFILVIALFVIMFVPQMSLFLLK